MFLKCVNVMIKEEVLQIVREELFENLCLHTNIDWYSEEIDLTPLFSDYLKKDY